MDPREAPTLRHLPPLVGDDDDSVPDLSPYSIDPDDVLPKRSWAIAKLGAIRSGVEALRAWWKRVFRRDARLRP